MADGAVESLGDEFEQHPVGRLGVDHAQRVVEARGTRQRAERGTDGERDDVGDEGLRRRGTHRVPADAAPDRHDAELGTVDGLLADATGRHAAVQRGEERVGEVDVERWRHLLAVVGRRHLRHLDELRAVATGAHRVRTERGEHQLAVDRRRDL